MVLASAYVTTESDSTKFDGAARTILTGLLKSGVIGEFTLEQNGFIFQQTNALGMLIETLTSLLVTVDK